MNIVNTAKKIVELGKLAGVNIPANAPILAAPLGWPLALAEMAVDRDGKKGAVNKPFREDGTPELPFDFMRCVWPASGSFPGLERTCEGFIWNDGGMISGVISMSLNGRELVFMSRHTPTRNATDWLHPALGWVEVTDEAMREHVGAVMFGLLWFYAAPLMQPVRVEPEARAGKSVEWVRARSYYSVVHRRHAANRKEVLAGAVVRDNTLARIAHARRAHVRVLRSAKWGAKQGQTVWVRSAWVGPREWRDAASRQVYRVADFGAG